MDVHKKSSMYQILQFKQMTKFANNQKLRETSKRNDKK